MSNYFDLRDIKSKTMVGSRRESIPYNLIADDTITEGQVVYVSGVDSVSKRMKVKRADADAAISTRSLLFIADQDATSGADLDCVEEKILLSQDTHLSAIGDLLYVSGTAGGYSASPGSNAAIIGMVLRSNASTGVVFLSARRAWGGSSDGLFQSAAPTTVTIASGVATITTNNNKLSGEGASADDLDSISGGVANQYYLWRPSSDTVDITFKHSTSIICPGAQDIVLAEDDDYVLTYAQTTAIHVVLAFKCASLGGGGLGKALASTSASLGASLVGIQDSAALITATNVETALLELVKYIPVALADPGTGQAIPVTRSASIAITQNGAETNTLAIPTFRGQVLELWVDTDTSGARVITSAQRINQANNTVITMTEVADYIRLEAVTIAGALRWQVTSNDGCALS